MSRITNVIVMGGLCLIAAVSAGWGRDWTQDRFEVSLSLSESASEGGSSRDFSWSFDGVWTGEAEKTSRSITVDSNYSKITNGGAKVDRLKTWFRQIYKKRPAEDWNPVITLSTEGDHGFDTVLTVLAGGMRKEFKRGFVELTGGASKNVRSAEGWTADVGALFQYLRKWGRLGLTVQPEGGYEVLGEVRLRKKLRYTFDVSLDYSLGAKLGITYRLHRNRFGDTSQRYQYLGLTYTNN